MNIRKLITPLLLSLLITISLHADAQYFKLKKVKDPTGLFGDFEFNVLTGNTAAENRINTFLQGSELNLLPGKQKVSLFEKIKPKKGSNTGTTLMNFVILINSPKLFSVEINSEYSNGSLTQKSTIYNFDSQTGKPVKFSDLVTKEGYDAVHKFVINSRKTKLTNYIKTLRSSADKDENTIKTYSDYLLTLNMDNLDPDELKFQKGGLLLTRKSYSSSQVNEGSADIYSNLLGTKFLQPYLNEYGKCLLLDKSTKCIQSQSAGLSKGVFKGKINGLYPITLLITSLEKDAVYASYFYDQQGKKIYLRGTSDKDSSLLLKEMPSSSLQKNQELFKLKIEADGSLTGSWSNGKNTYIVKLN